MAERGPKLPTPILQAISHLNNDPLAAKDPTVSKELKKIAELTTITMPQLGESVTEGTIGLWLKQVNDWVETYDPLVEVETDKVNTEIPSPVAGALKRHLIAEWTTVPVGTPICEIDEKAERPKNIDEEDDKKDEKTITDEPLPYVYKEIPLIEERIDQNGIPYIEEPTSVTTQLKRELKQQQEREQPIQIVSPAIHIRKPDEHPRVPVQVFPGDEIIPLTPMRRLIAEHMVRSERIAPHVTTIAEVDMTNVATLRNAHKEEFLKREGVDLTYLPFAIKAVANALVDHPRLNAVFDDSDENNKRIIHRHAKNIGIAVALEDGLIVPVIKHADRLSITGLAHVVFELADKAKTGRLTPDDVSGGTFTVNNPGTFGSIMSTPILVQPQVAILATEAVIKRPVVIDDMIAIRSMMNMSFTFDHRALDGLAAARFLGQVKDWLQHVDENLPL